MNQKVSVVDRRGRLTIPGSIRKKMGVKEGDIFLIREEEARLVCEKISISSSFQMMQASEKVLSRDWDTPEEDEAWKDL
jgi:AbrB family looped-hinge helix DNA binding protein